MKRWLVKVKDLSSQYKEAELKICSETDKNVIGTFWSTTLTDEIENLSVKSYIISPSGKKWQPTVLTIICYK